MKQKLLQENGKIDKFTITGGGFNISPSVIYRTIVTKPVRT
jgi:hypothetical protein